MQAALAGVATAEAVVLVIIGETAVVNAVVGVVLTDVQAIVNVAVAGAGLAAVRAGVHVSFLSPSQQTPNPSIHDLRLS